MKRLFKYCFITFLGIAFFTAGFVVPWVPGQNGTVSVAKAQKGKNKKNQEQKRLRRQQRQQQKKLRKQQRRERRRKNKCRRNPRKCRPPTVSELPIQYMVLSGAVVIALSGGMVFYIRKRKMKNSLEA
jgi:hypothetical protein